MIILIIGAKWIYPLWKVIQRKGSWLVRPAQGEILRGCRGGRRLEVNEGADSWPQPAGVGLLLGRRRTRELAPNQAPSSPEGAESVHSHISPLLCLKPPGILFVSTFLQEGFTSSEQCVLMDRGARWEPPLCRSRENVTPSISGPLPCSWSCSAIHSMMIIKHYQNEKGVLVESSMGAKYCSKCFTYINSFTFHGSQE